MPDNQISANQNISSKPDTERRMKSVDGAMFILIPAGEFTMGSDEFAIERPPHRVRLNEYWMGQTPVTNAMYRRFVEETQHRVPDFWGETLYNSDQQPVVGVDYDDAIAYCRWAGGRLPTEAEWEYAARGTDGRRYPWGNMVPDRYRAVYGLIYGKGGKAAAVGTTLGDVSPFGVFDMAGNVLEWCADWFSAYSSDSDGPLENPTGAPQGNRRVMRGGCWLYQVNSLRTTERFLTVPHQKVSFAGFRMVIDDDAMTAG